jgi:Protein of unknown function (DUF1488)
MPLTTVGQPAALMDDRDGVLFMMNDAGRSVSVLVSRHALEDIDPPHHGDQHIDRFNEYRRQFEQIASDKYDKGLVEQDGTVCIRGRDLPNEGR